MPLSRTSTASGRSRSRSPAQPPPPVLQSPRQYLPPSHYAEAGGLTASEKGKYNKDSNSEQHWQGAPRSKHAAYLSPRSTASNDAIEFQSNSPQSNSRSPESRQKRESQILNLPLVESQLLPSLRDTIDRMTRPPSRAHSKAGPTTPTFKISSEFDSVWPVATSRPHTPQCHLTLKHTSEESLSVSEPSTPKPTHSTPKSVLKSALRSPNPRGKPEHTEVATSPSGSGVTLKSVRSLLRRKSSALGTIESPTKVEFKENKPPESFSVVRAPGRSRSRTDPGSRTPTIKSSEDVPIPLPNTPQPTSSYESRSFTSNIPRLRGNHSGGSRSTSADDSDLEYRLELEARQYRRLTVINAKIPSCTSSSESEVESIVLSPATDLGEQGTTGERIVGLGLDFMDLKRNADMDLDVHETTTKHFSMNTYASAGSIYTDEETEESVFDTGIDPTHQSSQSLASLDTNHNRRRETLLGLVRGLHRYHTPQHPVMSGDESEYNGEPGLAISSSGDVQITSVNTGVQEDRITQVEELESEVEQEGFENETNLEGPSHRLSRNPAHGLSFGRRPGQLSPLPFKPSNSPKTETESKRPNKSSGLIDGNPLKATATSSSKRKTSRYEHGSRSQANPPSPRNLAPQPQPVVRDSFNSFESVVIAKKSREAVARGREAFGIPPSESDEVYHASPISNNERRANVATLPHIDSVGSNIDGDSWDNDKNNGQLSVGAEALFREIGGDCGGGRWDAKGKVDTGKRPSSTKLNSDEVEPHRKSTDRTHSRTVSPSRDDHSQTREGNSVNNHRQREIPSRGLWRSTISSSTYSSLLRQHGEREMKRQEIIWELYRSELDFVEKLGSVVKFFILPLRIQNSKTWISGVPLEISKIFDWLEDIVTLHTQIRDTLTGIQAAKRPVVDFVAESLHGLVHKLEIYQPYLVKIDGVSVMLQRLLNDLTSDFGEFVTIQENKIGDENRRLKNVLQEPVKRLELYPNIFKQLLEVTPMSHLDYFSTLVLVHSTNAVVKALTEVKVRENEYAYIKDLSERICGLPHGIGIPHRERRLLCQGQLNLVQSSTYRSSPTLERPPSRVLPSSPNSSSTRTSRLASAIQEWNTERARFGSKTSIDTTSTNTDIPKSPLSEQFPSRDRPLHLQDRLTHKSMPPGTSIQAFLFSDLLVLTQPRTCRSSSKTRERRDYGRERWNLLEDIGLSRVLDVLEPGASDEPDSFTLEILPIGSSDSNKPHVRTVCLDFPKGSEVDASTGQTWIRSLRQSSRFSILAMSDPDRGERYVKSLNDTLDKDLLRILDNITASGLPVPKSPSMQLDDVESDLVKLEREERGWWSMRFRQVLKEIQFEERYSHRMVG